MWKGCRGFHVFVGGILLEDVVTIIVDGLGQDLVPLS
jgi:hypothetical protein